MKYITYLLLAAVVIAPAQAERIKDLSSIAGVRSNQLVGYGLVVGLEGTGDQTSQAPFTVQSMKNFLQQFGVTVPENVSPQLKNVAAVSLHAELPAFAKPGQGIDVTVSSIGNAQSLRGGSLLMAPLRGADGEIYALAQGNVIVSGFGASGRDGSRVTVNITSTGRIPNGATVERSVPSGFSELPSVLLNLHSPDFTTANRLADAVNAVLGAGTAEPLDPTSIKVAAPMDPAQRISFVSVLENIEVEPGTAAARVIVNSRTGTVVIGAHVRVMPAAVSHGSLTVTITESSGVSQPNPLGGGDTVVVDRSDIEIVQEQNRMFLFEPGVTLNEIVAAVNQVGAAPGDLVAILEALKQAGSLRAELIV
ncbi:MAG: flagellar basal body P-ring protein FlgI, partial [Gammaproteobacteria bacterium]|nr:flagellar basal body P-ring protein FlgI [Gammaproteobacteria bacterium]